jgi:hypothetical protein
MKDSVESDALVMPSSSGSATWPAAALGLDPLVLLSEASKRRARLLDLLAERRKRVSPALVTRTLRSIWRTMTSMCLSLIFTPCRR